jgi:hypothetical protein
MSRSFRTFVATRTKNSGADPAGKSCRREPATSSISADHHVALVYKFSGPFDKAATRLDGAQSPQTVDGGANH